MLQPLRDQSSFRSMSAGLGTGVLLCVFVLFSLDGFVDCGLNSVWDIKYL